MLVSQQDVFVRIKALLPNGWFGAATPVLDAVTSALAAGWMGFFNLLSYVIGQIRISTATSFWLDLGAKDFFGERVKRRPNETDDQFRLRIKQELVRDRCTRAAVAQFLIDATGQAPIIFEPTNPNDTKCYGSPANSGPGTGGYCISGGWGSLLLPFQSFIVTTQPTVAGLSIVNGWSDNFGGFGGGLSAFASGESSPSQLTDAEIYAGIARTAPIGCKVWVRIE